MTREEIEAAIARHAEPRRFTTSPYEDRKVVRVSGPFTVESLSPHRTLVDGPRTCRPPRPRRRRTPAVRDDDPRQPPQRRRAEHQAQRAPEFTRLDALPGRLGPRVGEFTEGSRRRTVAVAIGPEFGTVGPDSSATPPRRPCKVRATCCSSAGSRSTRWRGRRRARSAGLTILQARMNPDLAMGEELSRRRAPATCSWSSASPTSTSARRRRPAQVEIRGLDVYDPTTGAAPQLIRDDIACWFLDTNYDGDSFFVRHAYFTGADDPYDSSGAPSAPTSTKPGRRSTRP